MYKLLLNGKTGKEVLIDNEDIERVTQLKWWFIKDCNSGHAYTKIDGKTIYLHRFILSARKGKIVDHINRNGLDNRKNNLRFVTSRQNSWNLSLSKKNTSGVAGVRWFKREKKWRVEIGSGIAHRMRYIGDYISFKDAVDARLQAETVRGLIR